MKKIQNFIEYLKEEKNYSENTIKSYQKDLISFYNYFKTIPDNHKEIRKYLKYLDDKKLKNTSISREISTLKSFYKYLKDKEIIETNPMNYISFPKKDFKLPKFLYYNEIEELFEVPDSKTALGQRNALILELLYATGIRVTELVNIKLNDIDFSSKEIKVIGKGSKQRIVYYGEYAKEALDLYLSDGRKKLLKTKENEYLFINNKGNNLLERGVRDIIDNLIKGLSLKTKISPHTLRHTFATHMLNEGADLKVVQELLGHENLSTTGIYTHVTNERLRNVYFKNHPRSKEVK